MNDDGINASIPLVSKSLVPMPAPILKLNSKLKLNKAVSFNEHVSFNDDNLSKQDSPTTITSPIILSINETSQPQDLNKSLDQPRQKRAYRKKADKFKKTVSDIIHIFKDQKDNEQILTVQDLTMQECSPLENNESVINAQECSQPENNEQIINVQECQKPENNEQILNDIKAIMQEYNNNIIFIIKQMFQANNQHINANNTVKATDILSQSLQIQKEAHNEIIEKIKHVDIPEKNSLKDLLNGFSDNNSTKIQEDNKFILSSSLSNPADEFNGFFNMIYILNETDNGIAVANKLAGLGINMDNITIIYSDFPSKNRYSASYKYLYFMKDALDNALEIENGRVLLISDTVLIRNELLFEFNAGSSSLKSGDFDIIQFGFKKVHKLKRSQIDTDYYINAYPASNFKNALEATRHWTKIGFNEGRVGMQTITTYDSGEFAPQEFFAFSITTKNIQTLILKIEYLMKHVNPSTTVGFAIFDTLKMSFGNFYPNLFVQKQSNVKNNILSKYMWHMPSYS